MALVVSLKALRQKVGRAIIEGCFRCIGCLCFSMLHPKRLIRDSVPLGEPLALMVATASEPTLEATSSSAAAYSHN